MPLARALGFASLTFYGVGIILGAGIYSVLGVAAARTEDALWMSFALSSGIALLTALSYAELATMLPRAGAEFSYLRRAFPRLPSVALVTGLLVALSGAATAATVAIAFGGYLQAFAQIPVGLAAGALIGAALALNLVGVKESGWVNAAFTLIEAGGLLIFIALGATSEKFGAAFFSAPSFAVIPGAALVFFSFLGFENIANLAEEAKHPQRDLPRAIFASLAIASALYVGVAVAAVALLPPEQLGATQAPLADAARAHSARLAGVLGGIALFATANTALVSLLVASRVVFGIARDGKLPRALAAVQRRRKTPWAATLAVSATALALLPIGGVEIVASVSSFASLLAFAAVNASLIALRRSEPERRRRFRVPGAIGGVPILPALGAIATLAIATQLEPAALGIGGGAALALACYAVLRNRRST